MLIFWESKHKPATLGVKVFLESKSKRISKRGSVLKVRGGCYNYRFKLYK
jgi:hypothetical protein